MRLPLANVEIVSLLVEAGANVNAVDSMAATRRSTLQLEGVVDCVEVLLAAGADMNARNDLWEDALFGRGTLPGCRRCWPLFLRAGAEIPIMITHAPCHILHVRNAADSEYGQAHLARITAILAQTPRLPPEMVRKIVEFWLHAGYY